MRLTTDEIEFISRKIVKTLVAEEKLDRISAGDPVSARSRHCRSRVGLDHSNRNRRFLAKTSPIMGPVCEGILADKIRVRREAKGSALRQRGS